MGAPRLRSSARKRRDKETPGATYHQSPAQESDAVKDLKTEAVAAVVVTSAGTSAEGDSLTEERLYRVVARPATPEEHDNGWTTVAAQQQPRAASLTGSADSQLGASPNADEDIVDVLSQSVSVEFLEQQTQAQPGSPPHVPSELERKEADMAALENEKKELLSRLESVSEGLAGVGRRNRELDDENRQQAHKLQVMEAAMRAIEGEAVEAKKVEQQAKKEVDHGLQRIRALEAVQYEQTEVFEKVENNLQRERRGREELQRQFEEITKRNRDLQEQTGRLLGERRAVDDELQGLRALNTRTNGALETLLADLVKAEEERDGAQGQLEEVLKRDKDLEQRNRRLLEERHATDEELLGLRNLNVRTKDALDTVLVDLAKAKAEREGIQGRLEESEARCKVLESRNTRLTDERYTEDNELELLRELRTKTANALEATLTELRSASHEKGELLNQVARQASELAVKDKAIQDLKRSQAEIAKQPNLRQLDVLERRNRMLMDQVRRQSEQLRQKTLPRQELVASHPEPSTKGDTSSGIAGMVNRLNSEIFQVAAHMADSLDFTSPSTMNAQEIRVVVERASVTIGRPLALVLQATSAQPGVEFNSLPVQIGLQACLISCCAKIATSWCPSHWDYGDFLAAIYLRIVGSTPQIVAAKWRALTEQQLKNPSDNTTRAEMEDYILRNLVDALVIAGWRKTQSNGRDLLAKFRERLGQIVKLALRLNTALADDCEITTIHPNEIFDADMMDDAYEGEAANQPGDHVVCTTELGLRTAGSAVVKPKTVLRAMLTEETGYDAF